MFDEDWTMYRQDQIKPTGAWDVRRKIKYPRWCIRRMQWRWRAKSDHCRVFIPVAADLGKRQLIVC